MRLDRLPAALLVAMVVVMLALAWLALRLEGGELSVRNHLFYVPIVLAAVRFGAVAGVGTGIVAGLLAGPLAGHLTLSVWSGRLAAFTLIGGVVGVLASARVESWRRERAVAEREAALVGQRASLIQLVSHEFRTPLTVIRGSLETLRGREDAVAPPFRGLLTATERSVERLEEMVDVVLAAADELDTAATPTSVVDVAVLVADVARSLDDELASRLEFCGCDGVQVMTVEPSMWLAVRCLLDNARKFSPPGSPVEVQCAARGRTVELAVADQGPGLPPGLEELAFEPFTQGDPSERRAYQGLGLGLYTARRLARRLGGDVTLSSTPGLGTTATLIIADARRARAHDDRLTVTVDEREMRTV